MLSILFRFDNRPDADNTWQLLHKHASGLPGLWVDHIGIRGVSHIAIIADNEEVMHQVRDLLPFPGYDNESGLQVDWPPGIKEAILSLRHYFWRHGIRELELRYSPGLSIPIKYKRDPGTLI
jgi:hypothetical protein